MGKKAISEEKRWEIISYNKLGFNKSHISRLCKVSRHCITTTIENYVESGGVKHKFRSGRPRISTPREDRDLVNDARKHPELSLRDLRPLWSRNGEPIASRPTISRRLIERGLRSYKAIKKPKLSEADMKKRYKWCKKRENWTYRKWASIIFSDESNYQVVNRKNRIRIRRFKNEEFNSKYVQKYVQGGGGSIGIWGCLANGGIGHCKLYSGRMNAVFYRETLETSLLPSSKAIVEKDEPWEYIQDGAPCHRAKLISTWFKEKNITVMDWPARSPDLNPIEHIWSIIDRNLTKHQINGLAELEKLIETYWKEIPKETCLNLVESMPERIKSCLKARGGYFKY